MKKSHARWVRSCKGIGLLQLSKEAIELGQTITYDPTNITWKDIGNMLNEMYSKENMKRRREEAKRQKKQLKFMLESNPYYQQLLNEYKKSL